jgi:hypothetical protein
MTLTDLKGHLLTRRANLQGQLAERRKTVLCIQDDLIHARREADMIEGALAAIAQDLTDVETALQSTGKPLAGPVPRPT